MADTPKPVKKNSLMDEFVIFLKTFGIIGLAIAFVIGAAASKLVTAFVTDIVNPIVGLALPAGDLAKLKYNVTNAATSATSTFSYGDLISNIIDFLIIAFVVFLMYKILSRYPIFGVEDKTKPKEEK
jgi:large conductance mechanosensitive channel